MGWDNIALMSQPRDCCDFNIINLITLRPFFCGSSLGRVLVGVLWLTFLEGHSARPKLEAAAV